MNMWIQRLSILLVTCSVVNSSVALNEKQQRMERNGTIHVPAFDLPASSFLSGESKEIFLEQTRRWEEIKACSSRIKEESKIPASQSRQCIREHMEVLINKH